MNVQTDISINRRQQRQHGCRGRQRRRGQALLLAVLIMVFAALLGTTFITVVAVNLNQGTRETGRADARAASDAGLKMVNSQIVNSLEGEKWRPEKMNIPPAPGDPGYDEYYPTWVQAQGWARTTAHTAAYAAGIASGTLTRSDIDGELAWLETRKSSGDPLYVRFPDTRPGNSDTGPIYYAEVKPLGAADHLTESADRDNMLRISVIGITEDQSSVFDLRKTYKPTTYNQGPLYYNSYIHQYDTANDRLIRANIVSVSAGAKQITLDNVGGMTVGRTVMLRSSAGATQAVVVKSVDTTNKIITVNVTPTVTSGTAMGAAVIGEAAPQGSSGDFSSEGDTTLNTAYDNTLAEQHGAGAAGWLIQGGAITSNQKLNVGLNSSITTSLLRVYGAFQNGGSAETIVTDANGGASTQINSSALLKVNTDLDNTDPTNANASVQKLAPPMLDDRFARYRALTKHADLDNGSSYGYGPGLYINNGDDVEKVASGASYRQLTNSELHRLWQRKSFTVQSGESGNITYTGAAGVIATGTAAFRLAYPRVGTDTYTYPMGSGSLEQTGQRGWVSPWEYRPRGALVEILGDGDIAVTLEDRTDGSSLPSVSKSWTSTTGGALPTATLGNRCYRMLLHRNTGNGHWERSFGPAGAETGMVDYPDFNGVIMAEGNIRVRGYYTDHDLTIVSMNNIYIAGSLRRLAGGSGHIALLAKNNVVVNPTQFVSRVTGSQDAAVDAAVTVNPTTAITSATTTVAVNDITGMRVGDLMKPSNAQNVYRILGITPSGSGTAGQLALDGTISSLATSDTIHLVTDPSLNTDTTTSERFYELSQNKLLLRGVSYQNLPPGGTTYVSLRHAGEKKLAFTVTTPAANTGGHSVTVKDNTTATNDDYVDSLEKIVKLDTDGYDTITIGGTTGSDAANNLTSLKSAVDANYLASPPYPATTAKFTMTLVAPGTVAARRLAKLTSTFTTPLLGLPSIPTVSVPLTVSARLFWQPASYGLSATTPISGLGSSFAFSGTYPTPGVANEDWHTLETITSPTVATVPSSLGSLDSSFYITDPQTPNQASMAWKRMAVAAPNTTPALGNLDPQNVLGLMTEDVANLPNYRVQGFFLEQNAWPTMTPALNVEIDATVFTQNGSWFVIPMPQLNVMPSSPTAQNREDASHYTRPQYKIAVVGNIAQNYVPTGDDDYDTEPDPDGYTQGAVRRWIDSLAYPTAVNTTAVAGKNMGKDWKSISYIVDPVPITWSSMLQLPVTPDVVFTG